MTAYTKAINERLCAIECIIKANNAATSSRTTTTNAAYETLENGAVERLDKHIEIIDGVIQQYTFTHFGSGISYAPIDKSRISPKPIKIQLGLDHKTISGVVGLSNIPSVTNSQGVEFPQHAYIHVETDEEGAKGIAYTTDGTDPTNDRKFQVGTGRGFKLDSNAEIKGFRAVAINKKGDIDPSLRLGITIEYNNVDANKDDI